MTEYDYLIGKRLILKRNEGLSQWPIDSIMMATRFWQYDPLSSVKPKIWWVSGTITTPDGKSASVSLKLKRFDFPTETGVLPDEELASIYRKSFSELISVRNELINRGWSISWTLENGSKKSVDPSVVKNGPPKEIHIVKTVTTTTTTNI